MVYIIVFIFFTYFLINKKIIYSLIIYFHIINYIHNTFCEYMKIFFEKKLILL